MAGETFSAEQRRVMADAVLVHGRRVEEVVQLAAGGELGVPAFTVSASTVTREVDTRRAMEADARLDDEAPAAPADHMLRIADARAPLANDAERVVAEARALAQDPKTPVREKLSLLRQSTGLVDAIASRAARAPAAPGPEDDDEDRPVAPFIQRLVDADWAEREAAGLTEASDEKWAQERRSRGWRRSWRSRSSTG